MRENRLYGSEGGAVRAIPTPIRRSARRRACACAGDSSGICAEHLSQARRRAITAHWIECGRRPYSPRGETEKGWAGTSAPKCPICEVPLIACGGGEEFDSWACDGCGNKATSHVDGRVAWAERGFNGYPRWNEDGTVQQKS
jgi:hypothetical protein